VARSLPSATLLGLADLLILAVMVGTFFTAEGNIYRLLNQGMAGAVVLIYSWCHIQLRPRIPAEFYLAGLFVAWSWGSGLLVAKDTEWVMSYGIMLARFVIFAACVGGITLVRGNPARGFIAFVAVAIHLSLWVLTSGDFNELLIGQSDFRDLGVNRNSAGLHLLWGIAGMAFLWGMTNNLAYRIILLAASLTSIFTLISTASRKSFISLLLFISLWLVYCHIKGARRGVVTLALVAIVSFGVYFLIVDVVPETYLGQRLEQTIEDRGFNATRRGMYNEGWEMLLENPLTGVGLGNFTVQSSFDAYSHSDAIEILSTTGAVGFCLYFPIYLLLWRRIRRIRRWTNDPRTVYQIGVYQALLLTILAVGLGAPHFLSLFVWVLLALMIGHTSTLERSLSSRRIPVKRVW